jgi:hypothetical protein
MRSAIDLEDGSPATCGVALTANVALLDELIRGLLDSAEHLPRLGVFSGPSGYGKSIAAAFAAGEHRAYYVECRSTWTKRYFLQMILRQQGREREISTRTVIPEMVEMVAEELALSCRPLIVDEMDYVVERGLVELLRDVYEQSQAAIVLIGEELLPQKLAKFERFHGRIQAWAQAQPCRLPDARELARFYCPDVAVRDDLLERLVAAAFGSARRVCVNLEQIRRFARTAGLSAIGLAEWAGRELHSGLPPKPRHLRAVA